MRGYYVLKARLELEELVKKISNQFRLTRLEAIRQLQDALIDIEKDEPDEY